MKESLRRLTALILALSMVMSLLSVNVWAADTSADSSGDPAVSSTEPQEAEPEEAAPEGNAEEAAPEAEPEEAEPEGEAAQPEEAETKPKEEQPKPKMKAKKQQAMSLTAQAVPDKVYYRVYDYSDGKLTYTDKEIAGTGVTEVTSSTTEWSDGTYVVTENTTISSRITVTGTVNLIIFDGAELTAQKGITVSNGNTLNIYTGNSSNSIQSTGQLNATALKDDLMDEASHEMKECWGAGIGGYCERISMPGGTANYEKSGCGNINIHGGSINVQYVNGNDNVAGIGGSLNGAGGNITIYYGSVTAYSYMYVSAIGAGYNGSGGNIAVYGGEVNAIVAGADDRSKNGFGGTLTVGKDVQVYALQGSKTLPVDLSGETDVAPEGGGQVTTLNNSMFTRYTGPAPTPAHTHNFTYTADGATITATCGADNCTLTNNTATLTIGAPTLTYVGQTGDGISAVATLTDLNNIQGNATVRYYKANAAGTDKDGQELGSAPTDAGKYWAEITLTNGGSNANDSATAHVVYDISDPTYNIILPTVLTNGRITADKTTAKYNEKVTLTITPDSDYICRDLAIAGANGTDVIAEGTQFLMPPSDVTVSGSFAQKTSGKVTLNCDNVNGTAALMKDKDTFEALGENEQVREGDRFILCVTAKDEWDFSLSFSTDTDLVEFSADDYQKYLDYVTAYNAGLNPDERTMTVAPETVLYWVTMPQVDDSGLTATVTFREPKPYTILYKPEAGTNPGAVLCKIATGDANAKYAMMSKGAKVGSDSVWSLTMTSTTDPKKVAFVGGNQEVTDSFAATLHQLEMSTVTVSQATSDWDDYSGGGKYLVIGGNAKVVTAIFVADPNAITTYKDNQFDYAASDAVTYQFAVCANGSAGTVTAPAAPTQEGYDFGGWRGVEGTAPNQKEKVYNAGASISISDNTTLNAVWKLKTLTVTLNPNDGTDGSTSQTVNYGDTLTLSNPTRDSYAFDGWTVGKAVTESGHYFGRGSTFDLSTPITADLTLTAQWKHVHSYKCYQISSFGDKLAKYEKYGTAIHVAACGCGDVQLVAHEFDANGKCKCGYSKSGTEPVTLDVSYYKDGSPSATIDGDQQTAKRNEEVEICAPGKWGESEFSKWEYKIGSGAWTFLTADAYASFLIPATMSVRAVYTNKVTDPTVKLSSRHYDDHKVVDGTTYTMANILYQMDYKLPNDCTFVDGGIKLGDNGGISYYFIQQVRMSYDNESKGIIAGMGAGLAVASFFTDGLFEAASNFNEVASHMNDTGIKYNYLETEKCVVPEKLTPATLAQYMYEGKPVNVEKYKPIYWEAKVPTKGMSGSIATAPPVSFAQKNNGNHYIYGIAWMRYKQGAQIKTIYTNAIYPTVNNPDASISKSDNLS